MALRIAIFGAHINSSNLGCQALTYSLLSLLERCSKHTHTEFEYHLFEYTPDEKCKKALCEKVNISTQKLHIYKVQPIYRLRSYVKHFLDNVEMLKVIKRCDIAIDITAGDSFSDIYGDKRFISTTNTKLIVEGMGIPLILGPQTYGPYLKTKNRKKATKALRKAEVIIARDYISKDVVEDLLGKQILVTTDLAFQLPYHTESINTTKNIGLNISGLLVSDHVESGIEDTLSLKTDYDDYISQLLSHLDKTDYTIYLIPHVDQDYPACKKFHSQFPNTILVNTFDNPLSVKSFISSLDLFIGARMHATIASLSSAVPTIPTSYSRKFKGVFQMLEYNEIVDLETLTTVEAVETTISKISDIESLKQKTDSCQLRIKEFGKLTENTFLDVLKKYLH